MSRRSWADAARAARQEIDRTHPPSSLDERVFRSTGQASVPKGIARLTPAWAGLALGLLTVLFPVSRPFFVIEAESADWVSESPSSRRLKVLRGQARVRLPESRMVILAEQPAEYELDELQQVRLVSGQARFQVEARASIEPPASVSVSHGTIYVLGTEFTVEQGPLSGQVSLHHGSLRFEQNDGRSVMISPGQTVRWPLEPEGPSGPAAGVTPPPEAVVPQQKRAAPLPHPQRETSQTPHTVVEQADEQEQKPPAPSASELVVRLEYLRSRGQFEAAAAELAVILPQLAVGDDRERLSFELGDLLANHLSEAGKACAHWQGHLTQFPQGRYSSVIVASLGRLHCEQPQERK